MCVLSIVSGLSLIIRVSTAYLGVYTGLLSHAAAWQNNADILVAYFGYTLYPVLVRPMEEKGDSRRATYRKPQTGGEIRTMRYSFFAFLSRMKNIRPLGADAETVIRKMYRSTPTWSQCSHMPFPPSAGMFLRKTCQS